MQCCHFGTGYMLMGHFVKTRRNISYHVLHNPLHICALHKTAKCRRVGTQVSRPPLPRGLCTPWDMRASAFCFLKSGGRNRMWMDSGCLLCSVYFLTPSLALSRTIVIQLNFFLALARFNRCLIMVLDHYLHAEQFSVNLKNF